MKSFIMKLWQGSKWIITYKQAKRADRKMRKHFSAYLEQVVTDNDDIVFITGDLGYNALENLAAAMGDRFINAGVAEQNMVGMAAGMASQGFRVICYSIAPFVVYRCLEQIRNDACFHNL